MPDGSRARRPSGRSGLGRVARVRDGLGEPDVPVGRRHGVDAGGQLQAVQRAAGAGRTAKRVGDALEDLARRAFPKETIAKAVTLFLATPAGEAAYAAYMLAAKPLLADEPIA
jgi:hypothetical protein